MKKVIQNNSKLKKLFLKIARDKWMFLIIIIFPFVSHLPSLLGLINSNPLGVYSGMVQSISPNILPGSSYVDPNVGYTSQALGNLAAKSWLHGVIPWWNSYEGIGVPLAGEMQSAALFPLVLLLGFNNGQLWFHISLQIVAGLSTYFLLKHLVTSQWLAVVGGILFELNGTFSWIGHAPYNPVAFLPLLLLGIEVAFEGKNSIIRRGFIMIALAIALSLYAGFPETAFLDGLFALIWAIIRATQLRSRLLSSFLMEIVGGGILGVLLSSPILIAFYDYIKDANIGAHSSAFADAHLSPSALPMLIFPYIYGPINGFSGLDPSSQLVGTWGSVGGYLSLGVYLLVGPGLLGHRNRKLRLMLGSWIVLTLAKTFGVHFISSIINLIPGITNTAFYRYVNPSWELAGILLAVFAVDDIVLNGIKRYLKWVLIVEGIAATLILAFAFPILRHLVVSPHYRLVLVFVILWALVVFFSLLFMKYWRHNYNWLISILLVTDAVLMFLIPQFSNPRSFQLDTKAIQYLQQNIGLSRVYTLGPVEPNYGSFFEVASINDNDLPISTLWSHYVQTKLDPNVNPILFTGFSIPNPRGISPSEALKKNLSKYQNLSVKYVITSGTHSPFQDGKFAKTNADLVYSDSVLNIYKLKKYERYFTASNKDTHLQIDSKTQVLVKTTRPVDLVRRELFFSGWHAYLNGKEVPIRKSQGLFQSIQVPAGKYVVTYSFLPPNMLIGAIFFGAAMLYVIGYLIYKWRKSMLTVSAAPLQK